MATSERQKDEKDEKDEKADERDSHHGSHRHSTRREPQREMTLGERLRAERHAGRSHISKDEGRREHRERHHDDSRRHRHRSRDRNRERSRDRTREKNRDRDRERHRRDGDREKDRHHRHHHHGHHHSRTRDKRHDHVDTQLVLAQKPEAAQDPASSHRGTTPREDVLRDPKNDADDALFAVDSRGDKLVWQFGTSDARRVPAYYRFSHGRRVLGTPGRFVFNHEGAGGGKTTFSVDPGHESLGSVFRDKSHAALLRQLYGPATASTTKSASAEKALPDAGDFIALSVKRKRKHREFESDSDSSPSALESDVSDALPDEQHDDDDADLGHVYIAEGAEARDTLTRKLAELSQSVKSNPEDVDAWLELVELQDQQTLLLGNKDDAHSQTGDERKGIAAAKLAILESALRQVDDRAGRERLQLAIMREGAKIWTPEQLAEKWSDLARDSSLSSSASTRGLPFTLWRAQLDHAMTSLATVTVDSIKAMVAQRMRVLERAAAADADEAHKIDLYSELVYVLLRATRFMYDAGFRDLATGIWQATLESTFARPTAPTATTGTLGQFWDSELPRIGEDGAQGWRAYAAKLAAGEDVEEALLDYDVQTQTLPTVDVAGLVAHAQVERGEQGTGAPDMAEYLPLYTAWAAAERKRADVARLPARLIDNVGDGGYEDVFRVVVFSDMEPLLVASAIPEEFLSAIQPVIIDAFLLFCQMPPAFGTCTWIETARNDPFVAIVVLPADEDEEDEKDDNDGLEAAQAGRRPPDMHYDGSRLALAPDVLFAGNDWFQYLPDWLRSSAAEHCPVPPQWVANVLRQLARSFGFRGIATYSLAADAAVNPAGIKKAARSLIKQYLADTGLYKGYALAEASRGNIDAARGVFASAAAAMGNDEANIDTELSLRQAWAWLELEAGQRGAAVRRLMLSSGETSAETNNDTTALSPSELLRLRQTLQTGMDYNLSTRAFGLAVVFAQSFVLLAYLTGDDAANTAQGHLGAALAAASSFSHELQARGQDDTREHERFLQGTVARIVYFHARHSSRGGGPYRPAELQAPVRAMVEQFPQNGVFLRLFAWLDPVSAFVQLKDPVRDVVDAVVTAGKNDCVSGRVFAVRQALRKSRAQSGYAPARAALARALGSPEQGQGYNMACAGSSRLWQAYVRLAVKEAVAASIRRHGRQRADKKAAAVARDIFYRAVRACPASKEVLLEVFGPPLAKDGPLPAPEASGMSPSDLRAVFQTLVSKGLRVHIDLGEVLDV